MNFKKFISGVSALAIAASAFAGLAVTASAAPIALIDNYSLESLVGGTEVSETKTFRTNTYDADCDLTYEADVYVPTGGYIDIKATGDNGGNIGPAIRIATEAWGSYNAKTYNGDPVATIWKDDSGKYYEINSNTHYSSFYPNHTIHITMTAKMTGTGKFSAVYLTTSQAEDDDSAFLRAGNNTAARYPANTYTGKGSGSRAIGGRNLASREFRELYSAVYGGAKITNATLKVDTKRASGKATEVQTFTNDDKAAVYEITIANDTSYDLENIIGTLHYTSYEQLKDKNGTLQWEDAEKTVPKMGDVSYTKTADDTVTPMVGGGGSVKVAAVITGWGASSFTDNNIRLGDLIISLE